MPKRILCKVYSRDGDNENGRDGDNENRLDGHHYTIYDNGTFIHSGWRIDADKGRKTPMTYKIENGFFYYKDDSRSGWQCDCQDGSYSPDDQYMILAIEEALEKRFIFGDDDDQSE